MSGSICQSCRTLGRAWLTYTLAVHARDAQECKIGNLAYCDSLIEIPKTRNQCSATFPTYSLQTKLVIQ